MTHPVSEDIQRRFKDHEVRHYELLPAVTDRGPMEVLIWAKPGTNNGLIKYVRATTTLLVCGDYGDAVYQWYGDPETTLKWIAGLDLGYFSGKCMASPHGRGYKDWDQRTAEAGFLDYLSNWGEPGEEDYDKVLATAKSADYADSLHDKREWGEWIRDHGDNVFGDDYWEVCDIGMGVAWECEAHLSGLSLAYAKLEAGEKAD